jgi:tripartite-type tricarboxylate transporter receptor subunit TctC
LVAGETALSFPSLPAVLPHVNGKRVRALGISSTKRSPLLPGVPTVAEAGVAGYEFASWVGVLAPAKTPPEIITVLNGYWVNAAQSQDVSARLVADGTEVIASSPAQFAAVIRTEFVRWAKVVKAAGLQAE